MVKLGPGELRRTPRSRRKRTSGSVPAFAPRGARRSGLLVLTTQTTGALSGSVLGVWGNSCWVVCLLSSGRGKHTPFKTLAFSNVTRSLSQTPRPL